ncbi:hypothetical protein EJ08DRAFT_730259 [Tothia fuscella]|uniref:Uncharacterized protein n=1 Tax=Tothia fuscella TaxID=1048955 RepID=A0A9P4P1W4_9PEZI|nr:hypothetical protein EJ08DRAFT_730259 [Tothia fuscella]
MALNDVGLKPPTTTSTTNNRYRYAMAALDYSLLPRAEQSLHMLMKRKNWAAKNAGVVLVFAIVFVVAILVIALLVSKRMAARKSGKA